MSVMSSAELYARYNRATAELDPPFAIVDLAAFDANAADLVRRAGGLPIRVATKSVRVPQLIRRVLDLPGFQGLLSYSLAEAVWLASQGFEDLVVAYPTADRAALRALAASEERAAAIAVMVDDVAHLDLIDAACGPAAGRPEIRVCVDIDTSWRPLGAIAGARRSPIRTSEDALALGRAIVARPGFRLAGMMTYEAQIAGQIDTGPAITLMKRRSARDIDDRRRAIVRALQELAPLELVNAGGTGSLEVSAAGFGVTELTAGSGLYGPGLFDHYRDFTPLPAALFALSVVRIPGPDVATLGMGGWIASGPPDKNRLPVPYLPAELKLTQLEAAGEVQTPVLGKPAGRLRIGDRVWLRHAKAGELCEHVNEVHLVDGDTLAGAAPTYRGLGQAFG
jgi:D-serine deaminase-like pyridoxal phosphate-dependent protein